MTPIDAVVGWRSPQGRVKPFVGGGATFFGYEETSDFADGGDDVDESKVGFVVHGRRRGGAGALDPPARRRALPAGERRARRVRRRPPPSTRIAWAASAPAVKLVIGR